MILLRTPMSTFESYSRYCGDAKVTGVNTVENDKGVVMYTSRHQITEQLIGKIILEFGFYYFIDEIELEQREQEEKERELKRKSSIEAEKARVESDKALYKAELKSFKEAYIFPFVYSTKIKIVLSGLSANSNGCGSKKNTVFHVFVEEDFEDGRIKRTKHIKKAKLFLKLSR